ncbi:MAG: hypothetical protein R6X16_06765 [Anaerolineae bacterium]
MTTARRKIGYHFACDGHRLEVSQTLVSDRVVSDFRTGLRF